MSKVIVTDHPLIQHKLTLMRKVTTGSKDFRELLTEISMLMGYEVTRNLPLEETEIETPIVKTKSKVIAGKKLGIVPILRAGLGMVEGFVTLVPSARVGHVGLYRDPETLKPVEYYCKLPQDIEEREMIIVDPLSSSFCTSSLMTQPIPRPIFANSINRSMVVTSRTCRGSMLLSDMYSSTWWRVMLLESRSMMLPVSKILASLPSLRCRFSR